MSVGIRPNVALAEDAGLEVGRGIRVDDHMATSDPAIFAVGVCVEHRGACYGLVAPLFEMCRSLAEGLTKEPAPHAGSVTSTKLKVSGIDVFSAGDFSGGGGSEDIVLREASRGGQYAGERAVQPMCKCTSFTHDDIRKLIVDKQFREIPEVMLELHWATPDGCSSCRPALNYYLLCAWPGEYVDDQQSRFVNERMHANIQKDGTYSVVPRMWGGITNPRELRAIADVVEKFNAPMVKVTGGQRIDIFGIRKEDLPSVWADLNAAGMVSGHAYGKALRTVKTCVGSEWCRFGTQDSTGLGVKIEQMTWGSWMPHKFKIAVSGCPRNCAEATIKDLGVVCVDSGYELHVGGNGGMKVRVTDLLCKVETEEEALHYCAAFVQLYREEARYLERTAPSIESVGVEFVKQRIADDEQGRNALAERFHHSQKFSQRDPWADRAEGADRHLHTPMAEVRPMVHA